MANAQLNYLKFVKKRVVVSLSYVLYIYIYILLRSWLELKSFFNKMI